MTPVTLNGKRFDVSIPTVVRLVFSGETSCVVSFADVGRRRNFQCTCNRSKVRICPHVMVVQMVLAAEAEDAAKEVAA